MKKHVRLPFNPAVMAFASDAKPETVAHEGALSVRNVSSALDTIE
jgi:hypothetical protein